MMPCTVECVVVISTYYGRPMAIHRAAIIGAQEPAVKVTGGHRPPVTGCAGGAPVLNTGHYIFRSVVSSFFFFLFLFFLFSVAYS